jgi:protein-S-isoprenylcysteine O-methyltransferase Ste14
VALSGAAYLTFLGIGAWGPFGHGHPAAGITFLAIFVGLPAVAIVVARRRRRRGVMPKPRTPAQQRRNNVRVVLAGFALIGALAIVNAKPADRLTTGIIVGVALAIVALLALPGS